MMYQRLVGKTVCAASVMLTSLVHAGDVVDPNEISIDVTPASQIVVVGLTAGFTVTITNTGSTELSNLEVVAPNVADCARGPGVLPNLMSGQFTAYACTSSPVSDDFNNTVTVSAMTPDMTVIDAGTSAFVDVVAALQIEKGPATQDVTLGSVANFTIIIRNNSGQTVSNITVSDALSPDCDRSVGMVPDLMDGETANYDCVSPPVAASFTNEATVSGDSPGGTLGSSDSAEVVAVMPMVDISKTPDIQLIAPGDTADFTITISNPNTDVSLTDISVDDPLSTDCNRMAGDLMDLAPAASLNFNCSETMVGADFTNVATVMADANGMMISNTDSAMVNVLNPIDISKTPDEQTVASGQSAMFTITITNDSEELRTNVAVSDPQTPDCDRAAGTLPDLASRGGTTSYTCTTTPLAAGFVNVATVTASGGAMASDTATVLLSTLDQSFTGDTATGTGMGGLSFEGPAGCEFVSVDWIPLTDGPTSPPSGSAPAGVTFSHGLLEFEIGPSCPPGAPIAFTMTLPTPPPAGTQLWKYGPTPDDAMPHWYVLPSTIAGNQILFTIIDGGLGDSDLTANGSIVDPGGPGFEEQIFVDGFEG